MVAGRRFWGHNEERTAQHQAGGGGDLGVETGTEDRLGAGESGGLRARVEAGRKIDEEDDGEAEQAEHEDDSAQSSPPLVAQHDEGENGGKQCHRDQQECVGATGGLGTDSWCARRRQAGVTRLADLDRAVLDELRRDEAGGRAEDGEADTPLRGEHGAGSGRRALRPSGAAQQAPFEPRQDAEQQHADRAQSPGQGSAEAAARIRQPPYSLR
jgi:hypothetical protein